ncbi:hydroxymethylbilane synthase [Flavobacteriaceae bacterium Ap0902]|nr:hydroxymethylbilane synthase [Flavobacteriaceae bacterium Ap0902]
MILKIGTRKSPLAMWQAYKAQELLENNGYQTEIVPISSEGDLKLSQPIYELGITGVFTKTLDIALINQQVDVAVHSLKDVPTQLAKGLHLTACLERGDHRDILVYKSEDIFQKDRRTIATGSLRRRAFWWNQFPNDEVVDLRGNVQLRLQKLLDNAWDAAIFAYAGLNRSEILQELESKGLKYQFLENMISAPSQGIVGIVAREDLDLSHISHKSTEEAAKVERAFLRKLQGGCTAPIGGFAAVTADGMVNFKGSVLSLDGKNKIEVLDKGALTDPQQFGTAMANACIAQGADEMIREIKIALDQ